MPDDSENFHYTSSYNQTVSSSGVCEYALKFRVVQEGLWGKLLLPTGLWKLDCPG